LIVVIFLLLQLIFQRLNRSGQLQADKTKRQKNDVLKNAHQDYRDPDLTGEIIEAKKSRGVKPEGTTAEKPNQDNNHKNDEQGSSKRQPETGVV
jgi:predicted ATP-dependent endonuclease of OLD family